MAKSNPREKPGNGAPPAEGRLASRVGHEEDRKIDLALRPRALDEFIGQERTKKILGMSIQAARGRAEVLDHVLFAGPPGLGKTSLAHIIARELGVNVHVTSGPAIERAADLAAIVNNLEEHDVLFIDEIHRLQRVVEERLYSAMEDFEFHIVVGEGMGARTMKLSVNPFTLVGATTRSACSAHRCGPASGSISISTFTITRNSARSCAAPRLC
ncbi:MAG TPA: AAA family ATPase [Candidatus Acidoferrum sp.]|nr:AAA family ATPase [Candidatus Acidoferrum sp.]